MHVLSLISSEMSSIR